MFAISLAGRKDSWNLRIVQGFANRQVAFSLYSEGLNLFNLQYIRTGCRQEHLIAFAIASQMGLTSNSVASSWNSQ
jgi:hypothetical protein